MICITGLVQVLKWILLVDRFWGSNMCTLVGTRLGFFERVRREIHVESYKINIVAKSLFYTDNFKVHCSYASPTSFLTNATNLS